MPFAVYHIEEDKSLNAQCNINCLRKRELLWEVSTTLRNLTEEEALKAHAHQLPQEV